MIQAEKRLGFRIKTFEKKAISVHKMIKEAKPRIKGLTDVEISETKAKVFQNIVDCIETEGYPTESDMDFKEVYVTDLVLLIILPIITAFRRGTSTRDLYLQREKEIIAVDGVTGGLQEFVGMDFIGIDGQKFVFVVEAKRSSLGQAKWQCLLSLKDIGDKNGGGIVYGFVTTGEQWQVIMYDGITFTQSDRFLVMSAGMKDDEDLWIKKGGGIIVDCIHMALRGGGLPAE